MDRDDLRGALRRHQKRMHRVDDIDVAGKSLDRWPLQAVPGQVQKGDRDARVDDRHAGNRPRRQAILPGAREEHEVVVRRQLT